MMLMSLVFSWIVPPFITVTRNFIFPKGFNISLLHKQKCQLQVVYEFLLVIQFAPEHCKCNDRRTIYFHILHMCGSTTDVNTDSFLSFQCLKTCRICDTQWQFYIRPTVNHSTILFEFSLKFHYISAMATSGDGNIVETSVTNGNNFTKHDVVEIQLVFSCYWYVCLLFLVQKINNRSNNVLQFSVSCLPKYTNPSIHSALILTL